MDKIDFSEFFTTKAEANDFLSRLTAITDKVFQTNFNLKNALAEQFGINKSDRLMTLLRENNINADSLDAAKKFLEKIQESIASLPVLTLTIAFEPKEATLKALSEWFLINTKKQVLFNITVNTKLVAGATINFNGKYFDFTIRPTVERITQAYIARITQTQPQTTHQHVDSVSLKSVTSNTG
jgi:F0F1-type ATP synthase delta subunit